MSWVKPGLRHCKACGVCAPLQLLDVPTWHCLCSLMDRAMPGSLSPGPQKHLRRTPSPQKIPKHHLDVKEGNMTDGMCDYAFDKAVIVVMSGTASGPFSTWLTLFVYQQFSGINSTCSFTEIFPYVKNKLLIWTSSVWFLPDSLLSVTQHWEIVCLLYGLWQKNSNEGFAGYVTTRVHVKMNCTIFGVYGVKTSL